ncbi:MAG: hypothetical protein DRJ10_11380 [Bacteroidetes bacterium]|nr:MAG: hypothetical protein DRJ10_11380 [Bacteroidota bacterium]
MFNFKQINIQVLLTIILLFINALPFFAQNINQLKTEIDNCQNDSILAELCIDISSQYGKQNNYDSAYFFINKAITVAEKNKYLFLQSKAFDQKGKLYRYDSKISQSIEFHLEALKIANNIPSDYLIMIISNHIGIAYRRIDDNFQALKYHITALEVAQKLNNLQNIAVALNSIGLIYTQKKRYDKALEYYTSALDVEKMRKNHIGIAINYNTIAWVYELKGNYDKAFKYYNLSLNENISHDNNRGIAICNIDIGKLYSEIGNYNLALSHYQKALKLNEKLNDKRNMATLYIYLAEIYYNLKNYNKSLKNINSGIKIAKESKSKHLLMNAYRQSSLTYEQLGMQSKAYQSLKQYSSYKDSIFDEESSDQLIKMQTIFETKKKEKENEILKRDKIINEKEIQKKTLINYAFLAGILFFIFLTGFIFLSRQKLKNAHNDLKILHEDLGLKKEEIQTQAEFLADANKEISLNQKELERRNRDITDSIFYAKKIQNAILPQNNVLSSKIPKNFIFFKAKDIVSGDFYWYKYIDNGINEGKLVIAVADSTGHGVPGAFMSMLGTAFLNETISKLGYSSKIKASDILEELRILIKGALKQTGKKDEAKDGMDMALCIIDIKDNSLQYSGAYNPLYIIRNTKQTELTQIYADKQPLSIHWKEKPFTNHSLKLNAGDKLYMFSDGYMDQLGGPDNRKFMVKAFKNLILKIHKNPMAKQKQLLSNTLNEWQGEENQLDDILIVGLELE